MPQKHKKCPKKAKNALKREKYGEKMLKNAIIIKIRDLVINIYISVITENLLLARFP